MHKFDGFEDERKKRLINAGFTEFGTHGYERSSLNRILQTAQIPKGLFYHYFEQKEDLYHYLIQFGINEITKKLMDSRLLDETDYIKRLLMSYMIKVHVYKEYTNFEQFLMSVYKDNNPEFLASINLTDSKAYGQRFVGENIDLSRFIVADLEAGTRVASRYMQQAFNDIIFSIQEMDENKIKQYLTQEAAYLKKMLYKEEYHD